MSIETSIDGGAMSAPTASGEVLSRRALNRAFLARQHLLCHARLSAEEALSHLVGMQAQAPLAPYVGLWTRLEGFHPDELARIINERRAVRIALMRSTIHLVTADDCLWLRPLLQPVLDRGLSGNFGRRLAGIDMDALAVAGRELVDEKPRTFSELGAELAERWPDRDPNALAMSIRARVPLVQVPPRGIWGAGGLARHTSAEAWLGRPLDADPSLETMVLRYLVAFGPASVKDIQAWCWLTRLGEVIDRLRPRLRAFRDEEGTELFDLPDGPRPDPDTHAPPRFLPEYDNALLSHANRRRIIADGYRERIFTRGALLVDGFARGAWTIKRQRSLATLHIELFESLSAEERMAVEKEATRLLAFAAADTRSRDVQFTH